MTTDITELAQKPTRYGTNSQGVFTNQTDGAYVSYLDFVALVEELETAQRYIEELREWNAGLAQESFERQQRISELLEGKVGSALLERENHHVEVVGKLTELIDQLETRTVEMPKRSLGFPHGYLLMPFPYYDAEEVEKALEDAGVKWSAKR
ncbi:hypothetical protein [Klebsiella quasipneumoniae]|uniref:hypothetical protein n=1 Tax=Klebsiella quasipneumoniae TaxID=1463165 RepID=UPI0037BEE839